MATTVVNIRKAKCDVRIDRSGPFGNPFQIGRDGTREQVIERYSRWIREPARRWLRNRIRLELRGKVLGCWCPPLACHGGIVAQIAEEPMEAAA